jgi:hypothetical protein
MLVRRLALPAAICAIGLALAAHALAAPAGSPAQTGSLKLCKVAGLGVAAGDPFSFSLTTQSVTRTVTVAAGACATLPVGTRATALTQGFFANHPAAVRELLAAGARLKVDSANLTAAQVQQVLVATAGKPGGVTFPSNSLLTLTQQLLAAQLNVLRGVVPPATVLAAFTQANGGIQVTLSGSTIHLQTTLSASQISALIQTLTGFNEAKVGGPGNGTSSVGVAEAPVAGTTVTAIVCVPAAACGTPDLTNGRVTAAVSTGATTEVDYTNRSTVGTLKVCKVAGTGIAAGTDFTFAVTIGTQTPRTITVAAGSCTTLPSIPEGPVTVAETLDSSFRVFSISCAPGCIDIDLNGGAASLTIVANTEKSVTFTNETNLGTIKVCKVAGTGVAAGTDFTFTVRVGTQAPLAMTIAAGDCATIPDVVDGTSVTVAETLDTSFRVFSISCAPGCIDIDLNGSAASLIAARSTEKSVTFTNETNLGTIKVCKVAGTGVAAGTDFTFTITVGSGTPSNVTIPAGDCSIVGPVPDGTSVHVAEVLDSSFRIFSIACNPGCIDIDLNGSAASLIAARSTEKDVSFTNERAGP